jgi:hypothetical protein
MDDLIKNGIPPSQKAKKKRLRDDAFISNKVTSIIGIMPSMTSIRSPRDETPIIINGKVVDLENQIEARIHKASPVIKPSSPNKIPLPTISNNLSTPAVLPYNDVNIVESPSKDFNSSTGNEEESNPAINVSMDFNSLLLNKINYTPEKQEKEIPVIPPPPIIFMPKMEISLPVKREIRPPEIEIVRPSIPKPIIPESKYESDSSFSVVSSKSSIKSSYTSDNSVENFNENENKIPLPIFNYKPRVISPIETLNAPKSPSPRIGQKNISLDNTPALTPVTATPNIKIVSPLLSQAPTLKNPFNRAPSPPMVKQINSPIYKVASPVRPKSPVLTASPRQSYIPVPENKQDPSVPALPQSTYIPPQYQQTDENMLYGYGQPDYSRLNPEQQNYLKAQFKVKFSILRANYPQWGIIEIHDSFTLEQINELYTYYIRQIMVSKETGNYKVYLVIFFMIIEVIGVKILKLNMSGYTMSQLRRMNQYDSLLNELGEKWLVGGGSNWPVEARLLVTAATNAVIFLGVKYLCGWMGVDGLADTIQNFFDSMINGPENQSNTIAPSSAPSGMNLPKNATVSTGEEQQQTTNPLDAISGVIGNLFGGNSKSGGEGMASGFADTVAKLGTMFTSKIQNSNKTQSETRQTNKPQPKPQPKKKLNKKSLFSD